MTLDVWKRAHLLVLEIYRSTEKLPEDEQEGLSSDLRTAALANLRNRNAAGNQALVRALEIRGAPGKPRDAIRPIALALVCIVAKLQHEIARYEEQHTNAGIAHRTVEPQVEAQPATVESHGALWIRRPDDDVIDPRNVAVWLY